MFRVKNAILLTLAGIFLVSLITLGIAYAMPTEAGESQSVSESAPAQPAGKESYLLRAYEGKLAVFTEDLVTPDLIFDVYVRTLPEYDREQLERGIRAASYEELTKLVEDYIS